MLALKVKYPFGVLADIRRLARHRVDMQRTTQCLLSPMDIGTITP